MTERTSSVPEQLDLDPVEVHAGTWSPEIEGDVADRTTADEPGAPHHEPGEQP